MNDEHDVSNAYVHLDGISKSFDKRIVLDKCSLTLAPNHIYGLVGRSGSGKSTLLRLIMGIYRADGGTCTVFGEHPRQLSDGALSRIGYVHQEDELITWLTGVRFLSFVRSHYPRWNDALLRSIVEALEIPLTVAIRNLSPGERQCLAIAAALAHEPDLVILDEPAAALDPIRRERFIKIILEYMSTEGRTIVLSSHLLNDLDRLIDHLVVVNDRHIVCDAPIDVAKSLFTRMIIRASEVDVRASVASGEIVWLDARTSSTALVVTARGATVLREAAQAAGWDIEEGSVSLEETFEFLVMKGETPGKR